MKRALLLLLASILCSAQGTAPMYTGFTAGSSADFYHGPVTRVCKFSTTNPNNAINQPCVVNYSDPTLVNGTLFYGYAGLPFSYNIPVLTTGPSTCDVMFTAFEPNYKTVGSRVFVVEIPGQSPVTIDLVALAGTKVPYTWIIPSVPVVDLYLHIKFRPIVGNAVINSILWNCH